MRLAAEALSLGYREGQVAFDGPPLAVFEPRNLERLFNVPMMVLMDPETGCPVPLPRSVRRDIAAGAAP